VRHLTPNAAEMVAALSSTRPSCDFRFNPATDSDLIPATVPI